MYVLYGTISSPLDRSKRFTSRNLGEFAYPALHVSFGWDTISRWPLLFGVYTRGSKRSHTGSKNKTCRSPAISRRQTLRRITVLTKISHDETLGTLLTSFTSIRQPERNELTFPGNDYTHLSGMHSTSFVFVFDSSVSGTSSLDTVSAAGMDRKEAAMRCRAGTFKHIYRVI